jgi:hypothetical protein
VIAERVVTFSRDGQELKGGFDFTLPEGCASYKVLVTDLMPGTWQILKDGRIYIPAVEARADEGTVYFEGGAGTYRLLR